jgi:hypothetical protein
MPNFGSRRSTLRRIKKKKRKRVLPSTQATHFRLERERKEDEALLRRCAKKPKGSLRTSKTRKLTKTDANLYQRLYAKFSNNDELRELLAHGLGISNFRRDMNRMFEGFQQRTKTECLQQDRSGTIIDNPNLAISYWTPLKAFLWEANMKRIKEGFGKLPKKSSMVDEYNALNESQRQKYVRMASSKRQDFYLIKHRLIKTLWERNGDISWQALSDSIGNWACANTVKKWMMSQEGFSYTKQKFIPALNEATVLKRLKFYRDETFFWEKVKSLNLGIIEIHQDEKNFLGSVLHKNIKQTKEIRVKRQKIHHKCYQNKVMFSCFVGAASIGGYDNGIIGLPVHIDRCCVEQVWEKKSTYKRVYNGSKFTYPQHPGNISREQGKSFKKDCSVTGSNVGTLKKPKYSLKKFWEDKLAPWLEKLVAQDGPFPGFIVKFQQDGAGAHQCKNFNKYLEQLFKRNKWDLTKQPPNSPLTNVLDLLIFPALSKRVSHNKKQFNIERGCVRQMSQDVIEDVVLTEFEKLPPQLIAKAFATQKHVINLIQKYNGYNDYIKERSALHSGVRRRLIVREGGAVSPHDIFQMATYGERLSKFFKEEKI